LHLNHAISENQKSLHLNTLNHAISEITQHLMGPIYTTYIEPIFNIKQHFLDKLEWSLTQSNIQLNGNYPQFETAIYKDILFERTDDHQYINETLILQQFFQHSYSTLNFEVTVQQRGRLWQSFIKDHPSIQLSELKYMIHANIYYIPNKYLPILLKLGWGGGIHELVA